MNCFPKALQLLDITIPFIMINYKIVHCMRQPLFDKYLVSTGVTHKKNSHVTVMCNSYVNNEIKEK